MELTLWTYEGPPHVGAIRVAASMRDVHLGTENEIERVCSPRCSW